MKVSSMSFKFHLRIAEKKNPKIAESVGPVPVDADHYLYTKNGVTSGFAITHDGEIRCLFSEQSGNGKWLMHECRMYGGRWLNCFAGKLVAIYKSYGFQVTDVQENWDGGPDVYYMERI